MKNSEFKELSIMILGSPINWISRISNLLKINPRTIRRIMNNEIAVPQGVAADLKKIIIQNKNFPEKGEWLIGTDDQNQSHIYHIKEPRFLVRVFVLNEDKNANPVTFDAGCFYLSELELIDKQATGEIHQWLERAAIEYKKRMVG
jgi:hypothetical protein